jgi:hypothetical protein
MTFITIAVASLLSGQDGPWSPDIEGTRKEALAKGTPCLLILGTDQGAL